MLLCSLRQAVQMGGISTCFCLSLLERTQTFAVNRTLWSVATASDLTTGTESVASGRAEESAGVRRPVRNAESQLRPSQPESAF